jgi:hypothetical protein
MYLLFRRYFSERPAIREQFAAYKGQTCMDTFFIIVSTFSFISGIIWLVVSACGLARLVSRAMPLLTETKDNIQDLGDLSANTIGRASDTMDLVELRVSQAMGNAAQGGTSVTKQALSVGTALAGLYMASRVIGTLRGQFRDGKSVNKPGKGKRKRRRG